MSNPKALLEKERTLTASTAAIASACAITGLATYLVGRHSVWLQWSVLAHIVTGIGCTLALVGYVQLHFRRTLAIRRLAALSSGLLTIPLLVAFIGSGWHLMLFGQRESMRWILSLHIASSVAFLAIVVLHVAAHVWLVPLKGKRRSDEALPSVPDHVAGTVLKFNLGVQAAILLCTGVYAAAVSPRSTKSAVEDYAHVYGEHRFRPSQTETTNGAFVEAAQIAESHRCASCHPDVARQWFASAHREAASDAAYVTNINLLAEKKGISATRYCEGCHGPIALLSGELTPGGKHGGIPDTPANLEGVSCMACHGIHSLVHLKGVGSYEFDPRTDHLFERATDPVFSRLHDWLLRVRPDQHRREMGKALLRDPKVCAACHAQFMDKDMNNWGWVKMQDEYTAWLESPYSKQNNQSFAQPTVTRCQDCHMPLVDAVDPSADVNGKIRSHHFPGANTMLPLLRGDHEHLSATREFLQENKLRISIDHPSREDALQTQSALDEKLRAFEERPYYYYLGETATLHVVVNNLGVGHNFPGGTIDINEAWVELLIIDAEGSPVYHTGAVDENQQVDPNASFYRSLAIDRNGAHVWRHDLFNMVGESFRRVIKAGSSDLLDYTFSVPSWAKSPLTAVATLKYRKLNDRYARWALKDRYTPIPIVDLAWDSLTIPVRVRKEVE